jgi:hypothetical protein
MLQRHFSRPVPPARGGRKHGSKPRFQETPESMRLIENLALEWSVRAAPRRLRRHFTRRIMHNQAGPQDLQWTQQAIQQQ